MVAGCAGFRPVAPAAQRVYAGETTRIALAEPPPDDTDITWTPGDGGAPVEGPELAYAWQKPGNYTVRVEGSGGADTFAVEVEPRPVLRAIPPHVRFAFAVPDSWSRFDRFIAFARRFAPDAEVTATLERVAERIGADPRDTQQLLEAGIDPAEGVGFAVFDEDEGAAWVMIGIYDEARAIDLAKRAFGIAEIESIETEAGTFHVGVHPTGEFRAFAVIGGYLLLRASERPGPIEEIVGSFAAAGDGLAGFEPFLRARALAARDDAIFFAQTENDAGRTVPLVMGVELGAEEALARFGVPLHPDEAAAVRTLLVPAAKGGPELARFPGRPIGFFSIGLNPAEAFAQAVPNPLQRGLFEALVGEKTGVSLLRLIRASSGNATAALYFEPNGFARFAAAVLGGAEVDFDENRPPLVAHLELAGADAHATIEQALARAAQRGADGWWQRGPLFFRLEERMLTVSTIEARSVLRKAQGETDFAARGAQAEAGEGLIFLDVAGLLQELRTSEARSPEAAVVQALVLEEAELLEQVRDLVIRASVVPEGVQGALRLHLAPQP